METGSFHTLAIVNNAVMNTGMHTVFIFFSFIPRSGIDGSYSSSILSFLKAFHIAFYSDCTNLHFPSTVYKDSFLITSPTLVIGHVFKW